MASAKGKHEAVFQTLVHMMKWTEMNHINLIINNIVNKNMEVLRIPAIGYQECSHLEYALKFMKSFKPDEIPFLRILRDQKDLKPLDSRHFRELTAVAHRLGQHEQPSLANYNIGQNTSFAALNSAVDIYVRARDSQGVIPVAEMGVEISQSTAYGKAMLKALEGTTMGPSGTQQRIESIFAQLPQSRD